MEAKQLNEQLWIIQDEQNINEMAKIEKFIIDIKHTEAHFEVLSNTV